MDTRSFLLGVAAGDGGGGSSVTVEELNVTSNGTSTAPSGKAYSPVIVNVPNTYAAGDEGKVVNNGALVSQTSDTVTANDTYDTTLINSLTVNVPSSGGSSYALLYSGDHAANANFSPSETTVVTLSVSNSWTSDKIIYVKIRDKAGPRDGYFLGSDSYFFNTNAAVGGGGTVYCGTISYRVSGTSYFISLNVATPQKYGVYAKQITKTGSEIKICCRYNSDTGTSSGIIDGTYNVEVYALDYAPNQGNPFDYTYPNS